MLGTAAGPHPYPTIVREFPAHDRETKAQVLEREGRLPDAVIACVGGGSNAIGMFADFIDDADVGLIGWNPPVWASKPANTAHRSSTAMSASTSA